MDYGRGEGGDEGFNEGEPGWLSASGAVEEEIGPGLDTSRVTDEILCQYPGCVNTLTYSGRGRKPKFCEEHKKASGGGKSASSGDKSLDARLKRVSAGLAENIQLVGALATPILPVTGHLILRDSERVASETVKLARNNPKMIAALEKANAIGPGVFLGRFMLTVGVAIAVDTQRIEPDTTLSMMMGVAAIYEKLHGNIADNGESYVEPAPVIPLL